MSSSVTLPEDWVINACATTDEIRDVEAEFKFTLPTFLRDIYSLSNGGEGTLGDIYFSLLPLNKIAEFNRLYEISKYYPRSFLAIATDGGDYCFGLTWYPDTIEPRFACLPLGSVGASQPKQLAATIAQAWYMMMSGEINSETFW